jgi:hypothetical protein
MGLAEVHAEESTPFSARTLYTQVPTPGRCVVEVPAKSNATSEATPSLPSVSRCTWTSYLVADATAVHTMVTVRLPETVTDVGGDSCCCTVVDGNVVDEVVVDGGVPPAVNVPVRL